MQDQHNINSDYWEAYPEMALIFSDFVPTKDSSKIMWCIRMYCDPRSTVAIERDEKKRLVFINKYFSFEPENYARIIKRYESFIPEIEITYYRFLKEYRDQADFLVKLKMTEKNLELKNKYGDKVDVRTKKLLELKEKVMASRSLAVNAKRGRGGYIPSRSEKGSIGR